ncbi:MAG TPA: serine hydrolase [Verrucomicrobiae bacterium]|nr:serine hydrolase [Verrucomicrobiae bacterium]
MGDSQAVRYVIATIAGMLMLFLGVFAPAQATLVPPPMQSLRADLHRMVVRFPASSAVEVMDLATGYHIGYNAAAVMPAASTIKVPVMVEVFAQLEAGRFQLDRRVTLLESDKDYGSGELCDAPVGSTYTVDELLDKMIDISDNTATNMLIRLVGLRNINRMMNHLGLDQTHLRGYVRTDTWSVRQSLESSPADMVHLLALMAKRELVDDWSSNEMISILEGDQINTLLPEPLPQGIAIAHKTGSFFDTLNDVGIVYGDDPYVIAVMTTHLPSLDIGRTFIRSLSLLTFQQEARMTAWRNLTGISAFSETNGITSPDLRYWGHSGPSSNGGN